MTQQASTHPPQTDACGVMGPKTRHLTQESVLTSHGATVVKQLALLVCSALMVWKVTGSTAVLGFLAVFITASYGGMLFLKQLGSRYTGSAHALIVILLFALFIGLNLTGCIGTLSGSPESTIGQLDFLIGFNFYALFVAGVMISTLRAEIELPSFLEFSLATMFGPKFISGPLEKGMFVEKFRDITINTNTLLEGTKWVLLGAYMCFGVSRNLTPLISLRSEAPLQVLFTSLILELRFYFNFAGISFMAYGAATALNISLTLNFLAPFQSRNVVELWRRWHVSFGQWFKHYVYLPLFNSGLLKNKLAAATLVFALSGVWHGISTNFMLWIVFQVACYTIFQKFLSSLQIPTFAGRICFAIYLCCSRFLVTEFDHDRLIRKLSNFLSADTWQITPSLGSMPNSSFLAVALAVVFLIAEGKSLRINPTRPYELFFSLRWMAFHLALLMLIGTRFGAGAVYGRA